MIMMMMMMMFYSLFGRKFSVPPKRGLKIHVLGFRGNFDLEVEIP